MFFLKWIIRRDKKVAGIVCTVLMSLLFFSPRSSQATFKVDEKDVVIIVLRQNLEVLQRSFDPKIAETFVTEVMSEFDTLISGQVGYMLDKGDKESIVFGTDNREILWEARAEKKLPYGVEGAISYSNKRESTNSAFATDPSFFDTRLTFEARAPFLKNRFGKSDQGNIKYAKVQKEVTRENALALVEEQVYQAVTTYWNLVAAHRFLHVANRFLGMAQDFLRTTQDKRIIGLSEDPDVLAAKALVVVRETEILRAKNLIADLEDQLRNLLDMKDSVKIRPKESLLFREPPQKKSENLKIALANRNDYLALLKDARARDIQIAVAKDQKWPSLDLLTSLQLNSVDPSYGTALGETWSAQHPNWTVGVEFGLSFENRLAKSALRKSQLEKAQLLIQIKQLENSIALQIDESLRELTLQRKEKRNFTQAASLQAKRLNIEMENYLVGRSSSDIIVRFQEDYLSAEKRRLEAELRLRLAWVDLRRNMSILIPENLKKLPSETR